MSKIGYGQTFNCSERGLPTLVVGVPDPSGPEADGSSELPIECPLTRRCRLGRAQKASWPSRPSLSGGGRHDKRSGAHSVAATSYVDARVIITL